MRVIDTDVLPLMDVAIESRATNGAPADGAAAEPGSDS